MGAVLSSVLEMIRVTRGVEARGTVVCGLLCVFAAAQRTSANRGYAGANSCIQPKHPCQGKTRASTSAEEAEYVPPESECWHEQCSIGVDS